MAVYTLGTNGDVIEIDDTEELKKISNVNSSVKNSIEDKKDLDWTLSSAANSSKLTKVTDSTITNNTHGFAIDADTETDNSDQVVYKNYNSPFGDPNDLSKVDNFSSRYQLDGLQGLNTLNSLNEGANSAIATADFIIVYFSLIARMLVLNSILNVVLNVSTRIPEDYKNFLGSYKNKNVDYIAKYLSERYNYPVDLYKKEGNFLGSAFGLEDTKSTLMITNVAFLLGLNEFLFPGNGISKDLDNYIQNNIAPPNLEESNFYNFFNALATAGIEYLSAEEDSKNRIKLLMRKLEMSYDFNYSLNEMEKNNFDPIVKFLFENVFDNYAFKFLIERINVGLRFMSKKHEDNAKDFDKKIAFYSEGKTYDGSIDYELYENNLNLSRLNEVSYTSIANTNSALLLHKSAKVFASNDFEYIKSTKKFIPSNYNRLSRETVEAIEYAIDSDYMPFSIQDLRTNEVIGLNAFIESYSDSFSAQYNETGGFGRVDKVMKWESTSRSISITFYMIATNKDDHDMMWYQINKMVTMLYPQWSAPSGVVYYSEGTKYRDADIGGYEAFRYPFTQVPTASPLVRIRLGDVLTNNYSEVNIKRIHGYGDRTKLESVNNENFDTDVQISLGEHKKNDVYEANRLNLKEGYYDIKENSRSLIYNKIKITPDDKAIIFPRREGLSKIECKYSLTIYNYENTLKDQKEIEVGILFFNDGNKKVFDNIEFLSAQIKIMPTQLKEVKPLTNRVPLDLEGISSEKLNNPITAGFATTMGKGLAGMISSFNVDFSSELPWEIDRGSRAPIYTKVTMQFKPIHDIAPGLDHNGMMRAPVYKVGNIVNGLN